MEAQPEAWERSLYFLSYAVCATFAFVVMLFAFYFRHKREGAPINYTVLSVTGLSALAMWIGVGLTEMIYVPRTTAAGLTAFFVGFSIALFMTWQLMKMARRIEEDRKTIHELATTDALTGLLNLRMFHERLEGEVVRATRFAQPLSLMVVDLVDLGQINDSYGYRSGDMVLVELGRRLSDATRTVDQVFRIGADTLAVLLLQTEGDAAGAFARRLVGRLIAPPYELGGWSQHTPIVSVGVAALGGKVKEDRQLLKAAKKAGGAASAEGDNIVGLYQPDGAIKILEADPLPVTATEGAPKDDGEGSAEATS